MDAKDKSLGSSIISPTCDFGHYLLRQTVLTRASGLHVFANTLLKILEGFQKS